MILVPRFPASLALIVLVSPARRRRACRPGRPGGRHAGRPDARPGDRPGRTGHPGPPW